MGWWFAKRMCKKKMWEPLVIGGLQSRCADRQPQALVVSYPKVCKQHGTKMGKGKRRKRYMALTKCRCFVLYK